MTYTMTESEHATVCAAREILKRFISHQPVISRWDVLNDYLQATLVPRRIEAVHVLFLDRNNRLIEDWHAGEGDVSNAPVYPREIARRALMLDASAVIISHNHPSGDLTPSRSDQSMTKKVQEALSCIDVTLHDHVIVAAGGTFSFRAEGII